MNGNNKHKDFKMGLFTIGIVISLGTIVIASLQETPSFVNAAEGDYTMNFSSNKNKCWTAVTTTESTATAKTALDNDVSFTYNNTGTALGYWGKINADGYFYNTTPIDGIKSIAITFKDTNGIKISYGWTANTYRVSDVSVAATAAGGTATYLFGNDQPSFFKIAYDTAIASIKTIALVYTCKAAADPFVPGTEGLTVALSGDGTYYIITGYTGSSTTVNINPSYKHLPIKEIAASAFSGCSTITSITLPESITTIGASAFSGCSSLTSLTLPTTITSISDSTFSGCVGLASLTITQSVTSIGATAFTGTKFKTLYYSGLESEWIKVTKSTTWKDGSAITTVACSDASDDYTFTYTKTTDGTGYILTKYNGTLTDVTIPSVFEGLPVKQIGKDYSSPFSNTLKSVTIPNSVTTIGGYAFKECYSLTSVSIPNSVTKIGGSAFYNCSALTSFYMPDSVTDASGWWTFNSCSKLASVRLSASIKTLGMGMFEYCSTLTSVEIPSSVTSIQESTFHNCSALQSIDIPSSVTSIGRQAFYGCSALKNVTIPSSVTSLGSAVFSHCNSVTSFTIDPANPNFVYENNAIYSKDKKTLHSIINAFITSFDIPTSVTKIGDETFCYCSALKSVTIPDSVTTIGDRAFEYCSTLKIVMIPNSVTKIGDETFCYCSALKSVTIHDSVTTIGDSAFYNCSSLTSVSIPNSVTKIGGSAFGYCSALTSFYMPDSVTDASGWWTFNSCSKLASVRLSASIKTLGMGMFEYCLALTSVEIPTSVTSINDSAFYNCSALQSIAIPSSVVTMGSSVFGSCSKLSIVCQAASQPTGWDSSWNDSNRPVTWGAANRASSTTADGYGLVYNWDETQTTSYSGTATSIDFPSSISNITVTTISNGFLSSNTTATYLRLPDTVTTIAAGAVENCTALTTVIIGANVTSIGSTAFNGCTAIEACYYKGTPSQWSALNFTFFGDSVAYYSETDKSTETDHYYWHYDSDNKTPLLWNA